MAQPQSGLSFSGSSEKTIPTLPSGIFLIVRAAGDPEVSLQKLSILISREPSFTIQLLRIANSALFSPDKEVKTIKQATVKLGARSIRNFAVAQAVRSATNGLDLGDFDGNLYWEDSLRRAVACRILAETAGYEDPVEAFTVGLIQDIGVLFLAFLYPERSNALQEIRSLPGLRRLQEEKRICGGNHTEMFAELARTWNFPDDLTEACIHHHDRKFTTKVRRTQRLIHLAHAADAVADLFQTKADATSVRFAKSILQQLPKRKGLDLESLIAQIRAEMKHAASELQIHIQNQPTYEDLIAHANASLIHINDNYEQMTQQLQQLLAEKEELTQQLQAANAKLKRLASTDALTGVANRRRFAEALDETLSGRKSNGEPISLIMLDIDHFKTVNDTYGHAIGDKVLVAVCERLEANIRPQDVVGRLGGEEFAILLPNTSPDIGQVVAERLRRSLEVAPVKTELGPVHITASFGGISVDRTTQTPGADDFLNIADKCLYASKDGGRNRVTWGI
jgi:diguanylate cyclase (GGDEF)-like protein